jgi:8-oxo-dGTP pyrophosphatase MutT (NUDIX family)
MLKQKIKYNLRVYALILNEQQQILLSDEYQLGMKMTKFPGGGMEAGEGTIDCLQREAMEEFGQPLISIRHFYTTDYYQPALFFENTQLVSIYYRADFSEEIRFRIATKPFDIPEMKNGLQSFRWEALAGLREEELTFPIDRKVIRMLQALSPAGKVKDAG